MADLFHDDVPDEYIDRVMQVIEETPQHTYQLLTKRIERMRRYFFNRQTIPQNVWLGVTIENNDVKKRISVLKSFNTSNVKFLSCEPLLSDLGELGNLNRIDWVIVGGETGPKARPMKKEWVKNIKRQCDKQGVPFFFKSWGRYIYMENINLGPKDQQVLLEGVKYQAYPRGWEKGGRK